LINICFRVKPSGEPSAHVNARVLRKVPARAFVARDKSNKVEDTMLETKDKKLPIPKKIGDVKTDAWSSAVWKRVSGLHYICILKHSSSGHADLARRWQGEASIRPKRYNRLGKTWEI